MHSENRNTSEGRDAKKLYLNLLKRSLLNLIYPENDLRLLYLRACEAMNRPSDVHQLRDIKRSLPDKYNELLQCRIEGRRTDLQFTHSMIGLKRMDNLQECAEAIFSDGIDGDFIETGVWQGGAVIFMKALIEINNQNRTVWVADSFEGLPRPKLEPDLSFEHLSQDESPLLAIDLETVKENFRTYGLLDDRVRFLKGWFEDTLPKAPIEKISLLRLDGDLYESTNDALYNLYDKVSPGGFVIIDDYGDLEPCRRAVDEFREKRNIQDQLVFIDWTGVFWRKSNE